MPTTNLVASPNVKGDISSCTTNLVFLNGSSRDGFWTEQNTGFATNNCTGHVQEFNSWQFTGVADGIFTLIGIVIVIAIFIVASEI